MASFYRSARGLRAIGASLPKRLAGTAKRFRRDTRGVVVVLFALVALVVILFVGCAIDYSRAASARTEMQNACDSANLAAMHQMQEDASSTSGSGAGTQAYEDLAAHVFTANLRPTTNGYQHSFTFAINKDDSTGAVTGVGTYDLEVPTMFLGLLNIATVHISKSCETKFGQGSNVDFHLLVDTSMSLGLAATVADRKKMKKGTAADSRISGDDKNCYFACHTVKGSAPNQISTLDWAIQNHIKLRINVAQDGLVAFIDTLEGSKPSGARFRYSLATFNSHYRHQQDATDVVSTIKGEISDLKIGTSNALAGSADTAWTLPEQAFPDFATHLQAWMAKNASTRHFILLVTDGVHSKTGDLKGYIGDPVTGKPAANSSFRTFSKAECDELKATGATVGVIYTKYLKDEDNTTFKNEVAPYYDDIEPALRDCASRPGLFAAGDSPAEITNAFDAISAQARKSLYLTR